MALEPTNPSVWWEEDKHYEMPGGYGATPAERLDALYMKELLGASGTKAGLVQEDGGWIQNCFDSHASCTL